MYDSTKNVRYAYIQKTRFVAARILKIDEMAATDFKDTKGKPIKNAKEWESICRKIKECSIVISSHSGKHTYSVWMQEEMKKDGGDMGKGMEPETRTEPG